MIRMMTGFESGSTRELDYVNGYTISTAHTYGGDYSLYGYTNHEFFKSFPALGEFYLQYHIYPILGSVGGSGTSFGFQIRKATTTIASMTFGQYTYGIPSFYSGATLLGTGPFPIPQNRFVLLEFYLKIADSDGIFEVLLDGIEYFLFVGDTKPGDDVTADVLWFENWFLQNWIDNIIVNDITGGRNDNWPGGLKIVQLKPISAGDHSQWTPSTGVNHYAVVDEVPPSEDDYLSTNSVSVAELFVLEDMPSEAKYIAAIKTELWAWKTGVPDPTGVAALLKTDGAEYLSDEILLPTSVAPLFALWESNPHTGQLWTVAQVNDLQMGMITTPTTTSTTASTTSTTTTT